VSALLDILRAFAMKRWTLSRLRSAADVRARRERLLPQHLARIGRTIPFYRAHAGKPFEAWPIVDKEIALANFGVMNAHGIGSDEAWRAAEQGLRRANSSGCVAGLTVGTSTGTSGNRGLFIVSERERRLWLGSILARTLPDFPFAAHRVAVMLATGNALYDTSRQSRRLSFAFFDIRDGVRPHFGRLEAFRPDTIVASPKVLRFLAENGCAIRPQRIFAGGEVLDPLDSDPVTACFGVAPRSIYQATEGFLGVACPLGTIHLNDDDMIFEREAVAGHPDRFVPIITDLRRTSQAMIRYRLNDILIPATSPCRCGSLLTPIARIEGRCDDVIRVSAASGSGRIAIMPEAIRAAILDADRALTDFRFEQQSDARFCLRLPPDARPGTEAAVAAAVVDLFRRHGATDAIEISQGRGIDAAFARKLRRVIGLPANPRETGTPQ
jgi:putative adenylate-forming enzyme